MGRSVFSTENVFLFSLWENDQNIPTADPNEKETDKWFLDISIKIVKLSSIKKGT